MLNYNLVCATHLRFAHQAGICLCYTYHRQRRKTRWGGGKKRCTPLQPIPLVQQRHEGLRFTAHDFTIYLIEVNYDL